MSTWASDRGRDALRSGTRALFLSLLCAVFGMVYERFGHGVWSPYMVYAFLLPLCLCAAPALLLALRRREMPPRWARVLWNCGAAALTVGSLVRGALEIYGTDSRLLPVYRYAGFLLLSAAALGCLVRRLLVRASGAPAGRRPRQHP